MADHSQQSVLMKERLKTIAVHVARIILGVTFLFSGFVKAIDPLGSQYKFQDYAAALGLSDFVPDWLTLSAAVFLSTLEIALGMFLLLSIGRRIVSRVAWIFMAVMTAITVWIYVADPVQDCGCFGEALKLTNGQTLAKNIVLLALTTVAAAWPLSARRLMGRASQWMVVQITVIGSIAVSMWCLYDLPLIDFRPYHVGANIREGMEIPEDAEQPVFETTFIMSKDGETKEFTLEEYPDSTWTFVDSRTVTVKEGYVPPIRDFSITNDKEEDITDAVLSDRRFTFLLISPYLEHADDMNFGVIDQIYEYCQDHGCPFICLTSSGEADINRWRDITGAEYQFCHTDGTTLKTIIRSNPGLVLIRRGTVLGKWSHNRLPDVDDLDQMLKGL